MLIINPIYSISPVVGQSSYLINETFYWLQVTYENGAVVSHDTQIINGHHVTKRSVANGDHLPTANGDGSRSELDRRVSHTYYVPPTTKAQQQQQHRQTGQQQQHYYQNGTKSPEAKENGGKSYLKGGSRNGIFNLTVHEETKE